LQLLLDVCVQMLQIVRAQLACTRLSAVAVRGGAAAAERRIGPSVLAELQSPAPTPAAAAPFAPLSAHTPRCSSDFLEDACARLPVFSSLAA
jgi:hypothetical protein